VAARRKLIVASNRAPVSYRLTEEGERIARRGGGGLVTALRSLVSHHDVTWIASAMTEEDRNVSAEAGGEAFEEIARDGSSYRLRFVVTDPAAYDWHYNVVSNPTLWFIQHYLWDLAYEPAFDHGLHHAWEEGYVPVNRAFADAILAELEREPGATVFLHDYHLYLAPYFVRQQAPDALLAHFVHIPWPQQDLWRVLPEPLRRAVHEGLLGNDIVSFHARRWSRNFVRSCADFVGVEVDDEEGSLVYGDRRVLVRSHPISIDPAEFDELAVSDHVLAAEQELRARRPERLILRVDRTDLSKNIVRGFRAFEAYLSAHPEMHGRVGMLAMLDPSRQDIPNYAEYLAAIQRAARSVNDRFQVEGWIPIDLQVEDDFIRSVAAYKQYDVLLVNAIFDGLNLVAKEAPLCNERDGVLILSENTGAYEELGQWALTVNPFDVSEQAAAIHEALEMPVDERRERIAAIKAHVREHDLTAWIGAQLDDLDRWAARTTVRS
jgi:trehalose 6-phosphate synthase